MICTNIVNTFTDEHTSFKQPQDSFSYHFQCFVNCLLLKITKSTLFSYLQEAIFTHIIKPVAACSTLHHHLAKISSFCHGRGPAQRSSKKLQDSSLRDPSNSPTCFSQNQCPSADLCFNRCLQILLTPCKK